MLTSCYHFLYAAVSRDLAPLNPTHISSYPIINKIAIVCKILISPPKMTLTLVKCSSIFTTKTYNYQRKIKRLLKYLKYRTCVEI